MSSLQGGRPFPRALRCALVAALAALAFAAPARAQGSGVDSVGNGGKHSIRGRILFPSGRRMDTGLKIKLLSTGFGDLSVMSDASGSFQFQRLRPGTYTVVIDGGEEFETVTESVTIESDSSMMRGGGVTSVPRPYTLQVYLQPKYSHEASARPGVLNAELASVPKPAAALYQKALEEARKNAPEKAVELLKAALAAHPDFRLALSELGVQYMKLRQPEKAAEVLRAALKLAPDDYATLLTYGRALYDRQEFAEAEGQFRKAAKKNPSSPSAHFYLGLILLKRHELQEAEREMRAAAEFGGGEMALAHYYLGGIYWGRQEYGRAADELESYLRLAPAAPDAVRVRATVKELRAKK
ncbi:MAG TPA: tetratricopeptide repeat protein [Pyrinomonadaceae bacterium]|jgi:Flp pilus assembly protein TadD